MRKVLVAAILAAASVHPAIALAQDASVPPADGTAPPMAATTERSPGDTPNTLHTDGAIFRGIRIEGDVGGDRFTSQHRSHNKFGYGGTVGFDGQYNRFVLGAEASYWRADGRNGVYRDYGPNAVQQDSFHEWGAAVRAGFLVTPELLVFGKGGYVNNLQQVYATPTGGATTVNRFSTDGYQVGGGIEYSLPVMNLPVYLSAQYVYSQYDNHSSRQRVMGGVGIRFR